MQENNNVFAGKLVRKSPSFDNFHEIVGLRLDNSLFTFRSLLHLRIHGTQLFKRFMAESERQLAVFGTSAWNARGYRKSWVGDQGKFAHFDSLEKEKPAVAG